MHPDIDPSDIKGQAPELQEEPGHQLYEGLPTVLKKLRKWGDYAAHGDIVKPTRFVPCKTPLSEEILSTWSLPEAPRYRLTVKSLLDSQAVHGRQVGMILDLSNHDCLYQSDLPAHLDYRHIKLVAKELPPPDFVSEVIAAADGFWENNPDKYIAIHCAYGFNRTGFVVCCYLIERCQLTVDQALASFRDARPPGVKHEAFRAELAARYEPGPGRLIASSILQLTEDVNGSVTGASQSVSSRLAHQASNETESDAAQDDVVTTPKPLGLLATGPVLRPVPMQCTPHMPDQGGAPSTNENDSLGANERMIMQGLRAQQRQQGMSEMTPSQLDGLLAAACPSPSPLKSPKAASAPSLQKRSLGEIEWSAAGDGPQTSNPRNQAARNDRMYGCLMGALVGDAAGAPLEFKQISAKAVQAALAMPGGGVFDVGPGQITDDGELALCLAQALASQPPGQFTFPAEAVAQMYNAWRASAPFDIGNTCRTAFTGRGGAADMQARAQHSIESKANGALMRAAPISLWLADATEEAVVSAARQDAALSHPSRTCQDANAAYCLALWHLINNPRDNKGAVARVVSWAQREACQEVMQWLTVDSLDISALTPWELIGFAKWAFCLSFHFLREGTSFVDALVVTLLLGGDTDTNAAIVCATMGALHGSKAIPPHMIQAVRTYSYQATGLGQQRPEFLTPANVLQSLSQRWTWIPRD